MRPPYAAVGEGEGGELPPQFAGLWCDAEHVAVTAYYRETPEAGAGLDDYAGAAIAYPTVVRLVEWNGQSGPVRIAFPGEIAAAYRTNLLGERLETLQAAPIESPGASPIGWNAVTVDVRAYEICTLYLDLVQGRKVTRDLDSRRSVWATSHWITKEQLARSDGGEPVPVRCGCGGWDKVWRDFVSGRGSRAGQETGTRSGGWSDRRRPADSRRTSCPYDSSKITLGATTAPVFTSKQAP